MDSNTKKEEQIPSQANSEHQKEGEETKLQQNESIHEAQVEKEEGNKNPYYSLSNEMKKYFDLAGDKVSLAPNFTSPFEPKKTKHHYCTHYFGYCRDQYYSCDDCSYNRSGYTMCFCLDCWIPELHIGHSYSKRNAYNEGAYCDCGRVVRIEKTSFCSNHGLVETKNLEGEIPEEEKQKFIKFFSPFFTTFFYQNYQPGSSDFHTSLKPVLDELSKLIQGSAYYSRLALQLLKFPSNYCPNFKPESEGNILYEISLFLYYQEVETFLQHVMNDLPTAVELARMVYKSSIVTDEGHANFMGRVDQYFDNLDLCLILMREGIVFEPLKSTFPEWATLHTEALELMKFSLQDKLKKIQEGELQSQIDKEIRCLQEICDIENINANSEEHGKYIMKKIFTYFPKEQETKKFFLLDYEGDEKQKMGYRIGTILSSGLKSCISTALKLIGEICAFQNTRISQFSSILENADQKDRFSSFLYFATHCANEIVFEFSDSYDKKKMAIFGVYIALVNASPQKKELINVLQKSIKPQSFKDILPEEVLQKIYSMISYFVNCEEYMLNAKMICKVNDRANKNKKGIQNFYTKADEEFLRKSFKSYLYEKQSIPHSNLEERRGQGLLEFEDAGKILNSLCIYDDEDEYFKYTSNERYPRPSKNFIYLIDETQLQESVVQNPTNLSTKFQFTDEVKKYASAFFNSFIDELWSYEQLLEGDEISTNQQYSGLLFLLIMIMAEKLTDGQNENIHKHLYDIQKGSVQWRIYTSGGDFSQAVSRALLMKNEESPEKKEMEEQINDEYKMEEDLKLIEMKKKAQQKKEKMHEKYKKTRVGVLQRMASKSESLQNAEEDDDECLVCHERKKIDNPLVYLAHAKMDNAISSAIHSGENKSNFLITTCFHTIHIQCFIKFDKENNMNFNCPLCSKRINCILPKQFNPESRKTNKICSNSLIASLIVQYKCYDTGSSFSLLFKHIIESMGLNSLTSFTRYESEKKTWEKNDCFIQKIMDEIYTGCGEEERNLFDKQYKQFLIEIEGCKKRVYYLLQYLFAKAIHCKLNVEDFEEKQLISELCKRLPSDQFSIILQNLKKLTGQQIVVDETAYKGQELQKESLAFNMVRPPVSSTEFKKLIMNKCEECKEKEICYSQCLMCGVMLCENCHDSEKHSQKSHNDIKLYLMLNDGAVSYETKNDSDWVSIYFNEFRTAYNDRESYLMSKNDVYYLNEIKLNKLMFSFMNSS